MLHQVTGQIRYLVPVIRHTGGAPEQLSFPGGRHKGTASNVLGPWEDSAQYSQLALRVVSVLIYVVHKFCAMMMKFAASQNKSHHRRRRRHRRGTVDKHSTVSASVEM